jgi:hypothetical protein
MTVEINLQVWTPPGYEDIADTVIRGQLVEIDGALMYSVEQDVPLSPKGVKALEEFRAVRGGLSATSPELQRLAASLRCWQAYAIHRVVYGETRATNCRDALRAVGAVLGDQFWQVNPTAGQEAEQDQDGLQLLREFLDGAVTGQPRNQLGKMQQQLAQRLQRAGVMEPRGDAACLTFESQRRWRQVRGRYDLDWLLGIVTADGPAADESTTATTGVKAAETEWSRARSKSDWYRILGLSRHTFKQRVDNGDFKIKPVAKSRMLQLQLDGIRKFRPDYDDMFPYPRLTQRSQVE